MIIIFTDKKTLRQNTDLVNESKTFILFHRFKFTAKSKRYMNHFEQE